MGTSVRQFTVLGLLVCVNGHKIMVGDGAHADDLPDGEAGIHEIAARIARRYGELYGDPEATWRLLRLWERNPVDPSGEALRAIEIGDMDRLEEELKSDA